MFKRTKIAAATMAILGAVVAPNVSAVAFDESGDSAQVLIFPYYNTNNGFQTAFNIRNTKDEYKVLKLRFRESGISNDVLDFNVYMSPYDHFSVTVSKDANGDAVMNTTDTTCTFPAIPAAGVKLVHAVYDKTDQADTREGYLEVIEQGLVDDGKVVSTTADDMHAAIKHVKNADGAYVPKDCSLIAKAWENGYFTQGGALADADFATANPTKVVSDHYSDETDTGDGLPDNMSAPTGGLQGYSILIDVLKGAAFVADPVAIRDYSDEAQHYKSDDQTFYLLPSLASGSILDSNVTDDAGTATSRVTWATVNADWGLSDLGVAPNTSVPSGINPLPMAEVLSATALTNDYFINPVFDAATDWVVTLPMRKHGIFNGYNFDNVAQSNTHPVNKFVALGSAADADVTFKSSFWNREEAVPAPGQAGFSPAVQAGKSALTREVNILTFTNPDNATNQVLGSDNPFTFNLESGFVEGWATLVFSGYSLNTRYAAGDGSLVPVPAPATADQWVKNNDTDTATAGKGVPMIGFAAIRGGLGADNAEQVGETLPHIFTRSR